MIITPLIRDRHVLSSTEYILGSEEYLKGKQVLLACAGPFWLIDKYFIGDFDELDRNKGPIEVFMLQNWLSFRGKDHPIGRVSYHMFQGHRELPMREASSKRINAMRGADPTYA